MGEGGGCTGAEVCNLPPYFHLRPFSLHLFFRHYVTNGTLFGKKKVTENTMCFDFLCSLGAWVCAYAWVRVALVIQNETLMRHIVTSYVAPLAYNFSTLSHKRHDFRKNVIEHKMCFDFKYKFV